MAVIDNRFVCDLSKPLQAQALKGNVFSLDNLGSRISVLVYNNGQPATISGSITANCILPDGSTVNVNGTLTTENGGSLAYVDVPQSCLLIPGILKIAVKCTSSSVITTLAAIVANVYMTKTDNVITPSQQIIDDWNAEISASLANQDAEISDLKSALDMDFTYLVDGVFNVPMVQGSRNSSGTVIVGSKYITSRDIYLFNSGTKINIRVITSGAQAIITEWTQAGAYVGNVGSWNSDVAYTFTDKKIAITIKKGTSDITPSSIDFTSKLITNFSTEMDAIENVMANDFEGYSYNYFLQGYYKTDGSAEGGNNKYCRIPMVIPTKKETYKFPKSSTYIVSIYTWDYNNGTYSNFQQTGWISQDTTIEIQSGKAMSILIGNADETNLSAASVDYTYYKLTAIGKINISEWTPKKVACVGDSLTQGVDVGTHVIAENYPYFMGRMLNCAVLNYGKAGADTKEYWNDYFNSYTFDSTIDTVLIMLGTNKDSSGHSLPNTLETDVYPYADYTDYANTLCGCYCKIIRKIIELTQNRAQVILITPPYSTYSSQQLNNIKEARETIFEVGLYYNLPVIDVFAECGMGAYNASVFRPHDGCHFNAKGYHRLGTFIGSKVKSLHSVWELTDVYDDETPVS